MLNTNDNIGIFTDLPMLNQALPIRLYSDKVLHDTPIIGVSCNTLSGAHYAIYRQCNSKPLFPFHRKAMLDDRAPRLGAGLFHTFGSSFPERGRILQQYHSQWGMVYTTFDSTFRQGRPVVLPRHRLFSCRQSDQYFNRTDQSQSIGHDGGRAWREASLQMPCNSGSTMPAGETRSPEAGAFLHLHFLELTNCRQSATGHGNKEFAGGSTPIRDCGYGLGGIHQKPQVQLRASGQDDYARQGRYRGFGSDRKALRYTWSKKNDANCGINALRALKSSLARLHEEILPFALFPRPPVIDFVPEREECFCGERLFVLKTRRKTVLTMTGPFIAREKVLECLACSQVFVSDALLCLVQSRCNVAYDVLVFVGQALFQRYRTTQEVIIELSARNVRLSASEVNYLGRKFIYYLAIGHRLATPLIRQKMRMAGGYILHLDATHDGDAPALMTSMDSVSEIVLANVKVPSEHADYIVPFLRKLQHEYGTPRACVHDMGVGICKAVADVFPGILDFICHFHFLRDIGKDFLEPAYRVLRNCLRNHAVSSRLHALVRETRADLSEQGPDAALLANAIRAVVPLENTGLLPAAATYSLALWGLRGKKTGNGYGFPFDRPLLEFACRLLELHSHVPDLLGPFANQRINQPLLKLVRIVSDISKDLALCQAVEELRWRCLVFDRLREVMRIAPVGGNYGLNDDGTAKLMTSIRQGVEQFRRELEIDPKLAVDPLSRKMAEQIDKYKDKLFADPIEVDTPNGKTTIYPQRTNNILEQFFRGMRRGQRRKTGNNSMTRTLQTMLADTPLVKNLDNPEYVKLLLNGKANLEELFAELAAMPCTNADESQADTDRILPGFRALINLPTLPNKLVQLFSKQQSLGKSN